MALLVGWQDGHPAGKILHQQSLGVLHCETFEGPGLNWSDLQKTD